MTCNTSSFNSACNIAWINKWASWACCFRSDYDRWHKFLVSLVWAARKQITDRLGNLASTCSVTKSLRTVCVANLLIPSQLGINIASCNTWRCNGMRDTTFEGFWCSFALMQMWWYYIQYVILIFFLDNLTIGIFLRRNAKKQKEGIGRVNCISWGLFFLSEIKKRKSMMNESLKYFPSSMWLCV